MKFRTIRAYNKFRKQFPLGVDSNGVKLYPWDYVKVNLSHETTTFYYSPIYWNALDGAYLDSHPSHVKMGIGHVRMLTDYLPHRYGATIYKVNYSEYEKQLENEI